MTDKMDNDFSRTLKLISMFQEIKLLLNYFFFNLILLIINLVYYVNFINY